MALISAQQFIDRFDIQEDIYTKADGTEYFSRITPHIASASRRLRKWVSDETYAAAVAVSDLGTDEEKEFKEILQNAEAHLVYHYAISGFNYPLSSKGVVGTAMASEGKEIRKYLTPDDTAKLANQFLELAREIAEEYAISDGTPTATFEVSEDVECGYRPFGFI